MVGRAIVRFRSLTPASASFHPPTGGKRSCAAFQVQSPKWQGDTQRKSPKGLISRIIPPFPAYSRVYEELFFATYWGGKGHEGRSGHRVGVRILVQSGDGPGYGNEDWQQSANLFGHTAQVASPCIAGRVDRMSSATGADCRHLKAPQWYRSCSAAIQRLAKSAVRNYGLREE
jgi:hypothetical protein